MNILGRNSLCISLGSILELELLYQKKKNALFKIILTDIIAQLTSEEASIIYCLHNSVHFSFSLPTQDIIKVFYLTR